jgi:phosphatidate phosphatase APP1
VRAADPGRGSLGNLVDSVKTFETDEIEGATVEITVAGQRFRGTTDDDGVFRVRAEDLAVALAPGAVPVHAELVAPGDVTAPGADGVVQILPEGPAVALISDFDDTVAESRVTDKKRMLARTVARNAAQIEPVPGVSQAFRAAIAAGAAGVFYVSGSPQNLHERIAEFLRLRDLPAGPILLKNFGADPLTEQEAYKLRRIGEIMDTFPQLRVVMVGDSGEKDPEIYKATQASYPGRVAAIVIRKVVGADNSTTRLAGTTTIDDYLGSPRIVADAVRAARP